MGRARLDRKPRRGKVMRFSSRPRMSPLSPLFLSSGDPVLDRRHEWARGLIERGEAESAVALLTETLERARGFIAGWFLLGEAHETTGDRDGAAEAFRRVLALDPSDRLGAGIRLARLGERKAARAMSSAYVRNLFDQYAGRFDRELVGTLGYNAPALLRAAIDQIASDRRYARVLDLGCGTGLMGEAIRDRAGELIGVDLSPNMIEAAKRRNIYERLIARDLIECLQAEITPFDLILAADVFVYFSDLHPIFKAAAKKISASGLIAFTVETHGGEGAILRDTLRFAHGETYVRAAAETAGLKVLKLEKVSTRREKDVPVDGLLAVLGQR
jgi:predicted TPR repeat methyltransferase